MSQSVAHLTADSGHKFEAQLGHINFLEIDCEIICMISLPFCYFKGSVSYWWKYVHGDWLTSYRTLPAQEKQE